MGYWKRDDLREYDYGPEENMKKYGQKEAPKIDYKDVVKAKVPIAIYIPDDDRVVPPRWQWHFSKKISKVVVDCKTIDNCNHNCF